MNDRLRIRKQIIIISHARAADCGKRSRGQFSSAKSCKRHPTEPDLSARKSGGGLLVDDEGDDSRARQQAAWAQSENLALTSASHGLLNRDEKITRFMFTLVIDPFRDEMFFWMLVVLFRSFLLAMVSIFFADEPVYQATLALLVLFLYTIGTAWTCYKPESGRCQRRGLPAGLAQICFAS